MLAADWPEAAAGGGPARTAVTEGAAGGMVLHSSRWAADAPTKKTAKSQQADTAVVFLPVLDGYQY